MMQTAWCSLHEKIEPIAEVREAKELIFVPGAYLVAVTFPCRERSNIIMSLRNLGALRKQAA